MKIALVILMLWLAAHPARAAGAPPDSLLCQQATAAAERASGVPDQLLNAISRVESGRPDAGGAIRGWPWTINVRGEGHYYNTKAEAVAAATVYIGAGNQSIDIGCAQINLMFHPAAFASLDDAFDPARNALYAARFLTDLFHQTGSWPHAAAAYHSQTPELGTDYQARVLAAWADPIGATHEPTRESHAASLPSPHPETAPRFTSKPAIRPPAFGGMIATRQGHGQIVGLTGRDLSSYRARPVAMLAGGVRARINERAGGS